MKLTIDTTAKTIEVDGPVNIQELYNELKGMGISFSKFELVVNNKNSKNATIDLNDGLKWPTMPVPIDFPNPPFPPRDNSGFPPIGTDPVYPGPPQVWYSVSTDTGRPQFVYSRYDFPPKTEEK